MSQTTFKKIAEDKIQPKDFSFDKDNMLLAKKILKIYFYHLIINFTWSFVFFYYHLIFAAFINIIFLIAAIVILMVLYFPKSKISFVLMIPYFVWVMFAAILNFGLYLIN